MVEIIKCSNCKSENIKKDGKRKTENRGFIQRYKCLECSKRFIQDDGFFRMRNSPLKITQSVDLFYRGASTRGVQGHLAMFFPHNASNVSVYAWVVKYSKMISKFTNKLKLRVGEEAQTDEIEYHRRKNHKKFSREGTEKNFFIDSVDTETRFMISAEYMKTRSSRDIKAVMTRIKDRTGEQVKVMTTDGWNAYENTIKKVFGYSLKERKFNVFHNRNICIKDEGNFNHPIERLHNNIRARTKTMRGFHGSISSANAILKGFEVYYNFINKQQAIKCCPYELATDLKLNDKNKWLELIQLSKGAK
jgi:transposase-like protein/DNA-directed RNA polymerase subunit RPC12/RpoP